MSSIRGNDSPVEPGFQSGNEGF